MFRPRLLDSRTLTQRVITGRLPLLLQRVYENFHRTGRCRKSHSSRPQGKYVESSAIRSPNENVGQRSRKQPTLGGVVVFTRFLLGDVRDSEQEKRGILETGREHLDHPWVNSRELGSFHPPVQRPSRGCKRSDRCF
jgi:hypothetical protein